VDVLWSPWRYDYIKSSGEAANTGCVFCNVLTNSASDEENFILTRAEFNFVILNIYPYTSGHLMVVPYDHTSLLSDAGKQTTDELMELTKRAQAAITDVYAPDGVNLGMNLALIPALGITGAAIATAGTELVLLVLCGGAVIQHLLTSGREQLAYATLADSVQPDLELPL